MNFLLLSLLAIQAGPATASGLNLWLQIAAVPPGSNTTAITETVPAPAPRATPATPAGGQQGVAAPGSVILLPSGGTATPQSSPPNSVARPSAQPGFPAAAPPGSPSRAISGGASPTAGGPAGSAPATGASRSEAGLLNPEDTHASAGAATAGPRGNLAAAPGRIIIGIERGGAPRSRRLAVWKDSGADALTVRPQQDWIRIVEGGQARKGTRVYAVTINTTALPPGRLHDGVIRVGSSTGWLDVPITVELHTTH